MATLKCKDVKSNETNIKKTHRYDVEEALKILENMECAAWDRGCRLPRIC